MSGVLVPCLMKVIHIQGHIPYVLCTAAPAMSGNGELKGQKRPWLMVRITEKKLSEIQRGHVIRENAPLQRQAEIFFQPFGCLF